MPNRPLSRLEAQVGDTHRTVEGFAVEAGKVAEFADAVHDDAPMFRSEAAARDAGFEATPAPPTFSRVSFFPHYRPDGVDHEFGFDLGFDREYVLHGEQRFEYVRPLRVGDRLTGETTLESVDQREGSRGGSLTFAVLRTDFRDADGDRVQSAWNTRIETDGPPTDDAGEADGPSPPDDPGAPTLTATLSRRDFVRYAGASGDFNPIHYDEPYAVEAGHPSVFAQGMLTAGLAAVPLRRAFGLGAIERYRARFVGRAFPGDAVTAWVEPRGDGEGDEEADGDGRRTVAVTAATADARRLVEGEATVRA